MGAVHLREDLDETDSIMTEGKETVSVSSSTRLWLLTISHQSETQKPLAALLNSASKEHYSPQ